MKRSQPRRPFPVCLGKDDHYRTSQMDRHSHGHGEWGEKQDRQFLELLSFIKVTSRKKY